MTIRAISQFLEALAGYVLQGLIQTYRYLLAPLLPTRCWYLPTCSHYGLEAIQVHGPVYGSWLTLRRFARCHPWGGHGYDPVPQQTPEPMLGSTSITAVKPTSISVNKATPYV